MKTIKLQSREKDCYCLAFVYPKSGEPVLIKGPSTLVYKSVLDYGPALVNVVEYRKIEPVPFKSKSSQGCKNSKISKWGFVGILASVSRENDRVRFDDTHSSRMFSIRQKNLNLIAVSSDQKRGWYVTLFTNDPMVGICKVQLVFRRLPKKWLDIFNVAIHQSHRGTWDLGIAGQFQTAAASEYSPEDSDSLFSINLLDKLLASDISK